MMAGPRRLGQIPPSPSPDAGGRSAGRLFGIISSILVSSSQSPPGPAGGASDGYGLGRRALDRGATSAARAALHSPHGTGRRRVDRTGLLRVAIQDMTIHMSAHSPPLNRLGYRVTGGADVPRFGHAILLSLYSTRNLDLVGFFSVPRKQLWLENYKA